MLNAVFLNCPWQPCFNRNEDTKRQEIYETVKVYLSEGYVWSERIQLRHQTVGNFLNFESSIDPTLCSTHLRSRVLLRISINTLNT